MSSHKRPPSLPARTSILRAAYRRFWARVGASFPDLGQAASTTYYFDNERRLFREHFPDLSGLSVFKTDLWDEARNTRILAWASRLGALAYGVDISPPTVAMAKGAFDKGGLRAAVSDVRELPFREGSFDAIYSMGTIEHFDETEQAVREMARVLKPGGRVIVGVPNRHDPFLRPLLSTVLQWLGLYAYGFEKSYSRHSLRTMIERSGLTVVAETAILFIPGWLRMLDLACHSWCRPLTRITSLLVWPFVFLDRHVPAVRRHGYLLATVAVKPTLDRG
ncbi:MAG: class I SAM-dependent methyltransferase [Vicinamibacteria bacterium]